MNKMNIAIVDDHLLFADGICHIILNDPDFHVAFVTNSVPELQHKLQTEPIHILILDINIPHYNGLSLMKNIQATNPFIKIMILTMYQPDDIGLKMSDFKGDAYVLKISGKQILEEALHQLKNGKKYIDPNIQQFENKMDYGNKKLKLTKREKEIVDLIAAGKTTKEIAAHLFLSELTIKTHRKNISEKLASKGVADMISKSIFRH